MGRGIAACLAAGSQHDVWICGRKEAKVEEAVCAAQKTVEFLKQNGVAAPHCGIVHGTTSLKEALSGAEFVFESISEDLEAKMELFAEMEALVGPSTVLCTNTSSLSVSAIAAGCKGLAVERVIAAHFIGPAHLVPLVELCPSSQSAAAAAAAEAAGGDPSQSPVQRVRRFLETIGKKPVLLRKEIDGFIAARLQACLYRECLHLVESGVADCEAVDGAVFNGFGRRLNQIGPFIQADFAGVDLTQRTHAAFFPQLGDYQRDLRADLLTEQGSLGVKTLRGHYDWTEDKVREVSGRRDAELLRRLQADRTDVSKNEGLSHAQPSRAGA